ncbi:hypothetical protein PTRG_04862 [Pyrenophora tritici-repentis Pt-1C-BFP]|uniref:MARVEL domain-containing protein n=1 Tax=Pyrenophora tritici-repentis (strain Pt-1C-BFP) TaxID=426418 RepID=B2W5G2_PYRTR|nr:uncharacterized protein PTRG_04862 [Pyrenophora tritici-repentis Pt-1C-BFP]EDU47769.1 hypothetical protein PTRG_04862 [Pyrenophora tritici-repentis Pt-1C-BFP]
MSHVEAIQSLRVSQGIFTVVNLALASYPQVAISLFAACVSTIGVCCAPVQGTTLWRSPKLFFAFGIDWLVAFVNLAALIALAVLTTKSKYCDASTCTIVKVNAAFTGFNFVNWAATATFLGMQLSKPVKCVYQVVPTTEKGSFV